jgi:hypothetical protein
MIVVVVVVVAVEEAELAASPFLQASIRVMVIAATATSIKAFLEFICRIGLFGDVKLIIPHSASLLCR